MPALIAAVALVAAPVVAQGAAAGAEVAVPPPARQAELPQGRPLAALVNQGLVPPREYSHSDGPIDPSRQQPDTSGQIYDIAYAGIVKGKLRFEFRGYSIDDLNSPGFTQHQDFPRDTRDVQMRDIAITVIDAKPDRLRYRWTYNKGGDQGPFPPDLNPDVDPGPATDAKND